MNYRKPESMAQLWEQKTQLTGPVQYLAGGTGLMYRIKKKLLQTPNMTIIDLAGLEGLKETKVEQGALTIGAMTTLTALRRFLEPRQEGILLKQALDHGASPQIRNMATLGGHIASCQPFSHLLPVLLLYKAEVILASPRGDRTAALEFLLKGPYNSTLEKDEIITGIRVPLPDEQRSVYWGEGERSAASLAPCILAILEDSHKQISVAVGGTQRMSVRLKELESPGNRSTSALAKVSEAYQLTEYQSLLLRNLLTEFTDQPGGK